MAVGIIGLGIMGSAYAKHLIAAGHRVLGTDPVREARDRLTGLGGEAFDNLAEWLNECEVVIFSLASPSIMIDIAGSIGGYLSRGSVVIDTGTFALADKHAGRAALHMSGIDMLDCTVSGTGAQAWVKDLVMMASGPADAMAKARPVMEAVTKKVIDAGDFGNGSKLKYVANHTVAIHNVAAAEALNYAVAMGLDKDMVYDLLSTGAGQSKMLDLRMPLMISGNYDPPTASLKMFEKDLGIIGDDIEALDIPTPLFDVCVERYERASSELPETHDTAAVYEVYAKESHKK